MRRPVCTRSTPGARSGTHSGASRWVSSVTGRPVRVTISIGLETYPDERVTDGESLLRLADSHLYRAKTEGRNRVRD